MRQPRILALLVAAALSLAPLAVRASQDIVAGSILPGWRMADGTRMAALRLILAPGWKTYWRAPGDAGIPPRFDWRGSGNLASVDLLWPTPEQTLTSGFRTIGYADELILPLRITPERRDAPIALSVDLDIGVCKEVCVPYEARLSGEIPADAGTRDPRIIAALAARPYTSEEAGVGRVACRVAPIEGGMELVAEIDMKQMGAREMVVVETTDRADLWVAQAETARRGDWLRAVTQVYQVEGRGFVLDRGALRFTVLSTGDAVDIRGCTPAR